MHLLLWKEWLGKSGQFRKHLIWVQSSCLAVSVVSKVSMKCVFHCWWSPLIHPCCSWRFCVADTSTIQYSRCEMLDVQVGGCMILWNIWGCLLQLLYCALTGWYRQWQQSLCISRVCYTACFGSLTKEPWSGCKIQTWIIRMLHLMWFLMFLGLDHNFFLSQNIWWAENYQTTG
jgi:hypothetical protein